jgi:RNA polymerase sigma-70 factor (ECF subfamily)
MRPRIHRSGASTIVAKTHSDTSCEPEIEITDMYGTTADTAKNKFSCVSPCRAPSMQNDPDDADLVARLQAHDETAFREIVERYASRICRVSYGILRDRDAADKIAHEVFVKVYFSIRDFGAYRPLYTWIHRITVNECYVFMRNRPAPSADPLGDGYATTCQADIRRDFINRQLSDLPEEDRWLLISKNVEGFCLGDLSRMTGLTENAIRIRLLRVRRGIVAVEAQLRAVAAAKVSRQAR